MWWGSGFQTIINYSAGAGDVINQFDFLLMTGEPMLLMTGENLLLMNP